MLHFCLLRSWGKRRLQTQEALSLGPPTKADSGQGCGTQGTAGDGSCEVGQEPLLADLAMSIKG